MHSPVSARPWKPYSIVRMTEILRLSASITFHRFVSQYSVIGVCQTKLNLVTRSELAFRLRLTTSFTAAPFTARCRLSSVTPSGTGHSSITLPLLLGSPLVGLVTPRSPFLGLGLLLHLPTIALPSYSPSTVLDKSIWRLVRGTTGVRELKIST